MPTHEVCQQDTTPEQSFDEGYDPELADIDAVLALYTGGGSASSSSALSGQNAVGNAAVNAALFGGASGAATHVVKKGETLGTIAKLYTGDAKRYTELWEANQATLPNPNVVTEGQVLVLPDAWFNVRPGESEQDPDTTPSAQPEDDRGWFEQGMDSISETVSGAWDTASDAVSGAWDWASQEVSETWDWASDGAEALWEDASSWWGDSEVEEDQAQGGAGQDPEEGKCSPGGQQTDSNATMVVTDAKAILRGDDLAPKDPETTVPKGSYVRILEEKTENKKVYVKVAETKGANAPTGAALGWTAKSNLKAIGARPARPSDPGKQMAQLLSVSATSARPAGYCYRKIKQNIKAAGGYGDILDIYNDERFDGYGASAVQFSDAVNRLGEAEFGLTRVGGLPADAAPGTLMVIKGNGQQRLSTVHGDINVIAGVEGGPGRDEVLEVSSSKAIVRGDDMQPLQPEVLLARRSYVWVLEEREVDGKRYVNVAEAEDRQAEGPGDPLGWTLATNLKAPGGGAGLIKCYNDGVMYLPADANTWTSGSYQGVLVGMYQPVARC